MSIQRVAFACLFGRFFFLLFFSSSSFSLPLRPLHTSLPSPSSYAIWLLPHLTARGWLLADLGTMRHSLQLPLYTHTHTHTLTHTTTHPQIEREGGKKWEAPSTISSCRWGLDVQSASARPHRPHAIHAMPYPSSHSGLEFLASIDLAPLNPPTAAISRCWEGSCTSSMPLAAMRDDPFTDLNILSSVDCAARREGAMSNDRGWLPNAHHVVSLCS
ncbi:hypothetical protein LX32DRAFT_634799 [Colletotrichum zoysiae]|uniref:Uncharacterized protein n=1 Tax=Colletotrichum zoysiae TaxID=1216348 RepID=A0AAD9M490_9PEZI|nr:hypothetical protein LX32DRAFT_634799 [Colletotrichum zoysiae]